MGAALITATQINFKYVENTEESAAPKSEQQPVMSYEDKMQAQLAEQLQLPSSVDTSAPAAQAPPPEQKVHKHSNSIEVK